MLTPPNSYLTLMEIEQANRAAKQQNPNDPDAGARLMLQANTSPMNMGLTTPLQQRQLGASMFENALSQIGSSQQSPPQ